MEIRGDQQEGRESRVFHLDLLNPLGRGVLTTAGCLLQNRVGRGNWIWRRSGAHLPTSLAYLLLGQAWLVGP